MSMYMRNPDLDFIGVEDTMAVFDTGTGDTTVLDRAGLEIVSLIDHPISFQEILEGILRVFEGGEDIIKADVQEFLDQMLEQHILLTTEADHAG